MIDKSDAELRAGLGATSDEERFVAAYVVGEKRLLWPDDLIPLLKDQSDPVRQAARRSLVILSFLELNPDEAALIASPNPTRSATPLSKLNKPVDFGPAPGALAGARQTATRKWTDWWAKRNAVARKSGGASTLRAARSRRDLDAPDPIELADALVAARPADRADRIARYRDQKGVHFTEALAEAITKSPAADRGDLRDALAERMVRMTDTTLRDYLADPLAEIRRAAALGLAKRGKTAHGDRLADLLNDPDPLVGRAAHTALCQLSGKDFGPDVDAAEADRLAAVERWKTWWSEIAKKGSGVNGTKISPNFYAGREFGRRAG